MPPADDSADLVDDHDDVEADADVALTPEMMSHMAAIRMRLDADEIAFLTEVYGELTPPEVARWLRELSALTVDEAIERVRAQIRGAAGDDHDDGDDGDAPADGDDHADAEVAS